eukprot:g9958.t1
MPSLTPFFATGKSAKSDEATTLLSRLDSVNLRGETGSAPSILALLGAGSRRDDNNTFLTALLLLNYMIGSGILNTPQTFKKSGLAATTALYFIACPAIWLGMVVLIKAAEASASTLAKERGAEKGEKIAATSGRAQIEDLEFATIAKRTIGTHAPLLLDGSIVVLNFGAVCSYVVLVGGLTTALLTEWSEGSQVAQWWESFYIVTPLIVGFLVLPPCLIRHFSNLRWLAGFSLGAIAAVVGLVILGSPFYAEAEKGSSTIAETAALDAPLIWWEWTGAVSKLGSVVFALSCAAASPHSYSSMAQRTEQKWKTVAAISVTAGGLLCYVTGLAGYLSFRDATQGDILDNFTGPLATFFKILVIVHLVMYIPSEVIIMRHSVLSLVGQDVMVMGFAAVSSVTVGILSAVVGVVLALMLVGVAQGELFGYIVDLSGGVTGSITCFVFPALAYLRATDGVTVQKSDYDKHRRAYRHASRVLIVFGVMVMLLVPVAVALSALGY